MGSAAKRGAVCFIAVIVAFTLIYQASRFYLAWNLGRSRTLAGQIRGAKLEGNAEAWDRIGEALATDFNDPQPERAQQYLQTAVRLDPRSADYWMDLAEIFEAQGQISKALDAYHRAQAEYPSSANVAWRYGNFLLRQGETSQALAQIRHAILADGMLAPLAIAEVWSVDPSVDTLLNNVLPRSRKFYFEALDFLSAKHEDQAALQTWTKIKAVAASRPLNLPQMFPFINELISSDRAADSERVWREALKAAHWPEARPTAGSAVWNGGFEAPIANGGLDWRFDEEPGDYISIDAYTHHSGSHSLRVDFTDGANLDFAGVQQFVPVQPKTEYLFQCFMRTRSITTDSGMRFEIVDLNHGEVNVHTHALIGTNSWTPLSVTFTTGPDTHFVDIRLRRYPSKLFDNKLGGTVWVDGVTLVPAENEDPGAGK